MSQPLRIVFLDRDTLSPQTVLRPFDFPHALIVHARSTKAEIPARIAGADIVITNKGPIDRAALAGAPRLRLIAVAATGTDNIDLRACADRAIPVSNIRDYAGDTLSEHVFALMLALRRSIVPYIESVKRGRWQEAAQFCFFDHPIRSLSGATLGIVGSGALGSAVAALARAFGMKVLFAARKGAADSATHTPFDTMLESSDVITLHCPLTPATRHLLGAREFALMRRKPLLINTARGGLVDEAALEAALRNGQISGAGFDVAAAEPPATDNTLMRLTALPNFLLTPHVAWASEESVQRLADQLVENVELFMRGAARHLVAPAA